MTKRHLQGPDPFERIREAQDHRYDPGFFTGGNIDPMLAAPRPNRYGWVLLIIGIAFLAVVLSIPRSDISWWRFFLGIAFALLYVAAGIKLVRRRRETLRRGGRNSENQS
jgi:phosphotransferase system  glucose/maltose/N-acetylglucosamine-specific IIC component